MSDSWARTIAASINHDANEQRRFRTPEAEAQIADARAEPTLEELQAQAHDPQLRERCADGQFGNAEAEPSLTLTGPELAAYLRLRDAAHAATNAQTKMAETGQALREAFGEVCQVIGKP